MGWLLKLISPISLIPMPYKILAIAIALAASHGYAFHKGNQFAKGQQARIEIRTVEKIVEKTVEIVKKDTVAAEKAARERDAERAKAAKLKVKIDQLLAEKPLPVECVAPSEVRDSLNAILSSGDK